MALDATGVGAVAGVPINVASAGLIATGATTMAVSAGDLLHNAAHENAKVLNEANPSSGGGGPKPGDPLPETSRPSTAGPKWEGRVADSGKGEVWQDPASMNAPKGSPKNANSVRIMDGDSRYPDGYVRFYNEHGQPLTKAGKPGVDKSPDTHFGIRPDGTYDIPEGWHP